METQETQEQQDQEQLEVEDSVEDRSEMEVVEGGEAITAADDAPAPDATVDEWKAYARKWENAKKGDSRKQTKRARTAEKERDELRAKLKEHEDADRSEQDKAIEAAREEGRTAALTESQQKLRQKDLALEVNRLAVKGIRQGEGDEAKTVKFADKGALLLVQQALTQGDLDADLVFDEAGNVRPSGLATALGEILEDEPWLVARAPEPAKPQGSSDAGRGAGGGKSLEEMTPEDHYKALQGD